MLFDFLFRSQPAEGTKSEGIPLNSELIGTIFGSRKGKMTATQAFNNSNIYTCACILSDDIAKLPLHTFRYGEGRAKIGEHPVVELLHGRANPYMSSFTFKQVLQTHVGVYGNGYAFIEWDKKGYPVALWPLDPTRVLVDVDRVTGAIAYKVSTNKGMYELLPSDVLHFKTLSLDGVHGVAPWMTLMDELTSQNAMKEFLSNFYQNGTMTSGVLKTASKLDKEAKDMLRTHWNELNSGVGNAGKIAVLDMGMDYTSLGMPLEQAQFIETQKFGINEVAKVYRIPPHKLAQMDRATYANAEAMGLEYIKTTLLPIFTQWEQEINYKLFTKSERERYYVKFNASAELRGDSSARAQYYQQMINAGIYSINEVRAMEELTPLENGHGDEHFVSLNYTTIENLTELQNLKKGGNDNEGKGTSDDSSTSGNP